MAHRRSPPTRSHNPLPISPSPTAASLARRRKYTLRQSPGSRRRALGLLHPTRSTSTHARRVAESQSDDSSDDDHDHDESDEPERDGRLRPVLAALHQNLRKLPSRLLLAATSSAVRHHHQKRDTTAARDRDISMRDVGESVQIGTKRKRVVGSNENVGGHATRGAGQRPKRIKVTTRRQQQQIQRRESSSDEEMEIDTPTTWAASDESDADENAVDSSDDHLLRTAPARQLLRLRKDELVDLYTTAGLNPRSSFESLTKPEIVDAIIAAREDNDDLDDSVELPPSSPRAGSECSSEGEVDDDDDGNAAGGEETDASMGGPKRMKMGASPLKRRATVNELGRGGGAARPMKGRSVSMGQLGESSKGGRRRTSTRSSPTSMSHHLAHHASDHNAHLPSPPATRTRSRKISNGTSSASTSANSTSANGRSKLAVKGGSKGKAKQVEFSDDVEIQVASPSPIQSDEDEAGVDQLDKHYRGRQDAGGDQDSELTDLTDLDKEFPGTPKARPIKNRAGFGAVANGITMPSPRRLRSRSKDVARAAIGDTGPHTDTGAEAGEAEKDRRVTPMRRAKGKIGSLREDSESVEEGDEEEGVADDEEEAEEQEDEAGEEGTGEDEEIDELVSSPSPTPPPTRGRRTPVKRRLRPRRVQTYTPPSDGDDEEEEEEDGTAVDADEEAASVAGSEGEMYEDAEEDLVSTTPRKLRSGRIVGEEDADIDVDESVGEEDGEEEGEEEEFVDADGESIDVDDTEEDTDEPMEDDIDLTIATTKTLVRLRRDDLVRLCETRDLDPVGTKPQLASALLEWRDRHQTGFSSPSSTGTIRPPSTIKRRRKSSSGGTKYHQANTNPTTPILLRSHHFHADEPRTPPLSGGNSGGSKDQEPELELDLESLGLEDREIPPEKLTKLEKIGSGGFKDVFIGKLKGRKVAISEFRGQLSAMDIKELKLLGGFDHPNIVRFLGVSIPENTRETPVMMISELCANGDLFDYVRNVHPPSLHKVLNMMLDIARGLEYLHLRKPSVIHRDCKSSNILITSRGTAKIADFGLAKVKQSTRSMVRSLVGTVNWQAPELWHAHPKYNHKVDVFSCAMVYWETLQWHVTNKKFPWEGMNEHAIYDIVGAKRQRPSINGLRKAWCPEIVDLIERMWAQEHQDRPTMSEVVEELEQMIQR